MIIKVKSEHKRFIDKCIKYKVSIKNISKNKDEMLVTINVDDYEYITKICYFSDIEIYKYLGKQGFLNFIKKYIFDLLMIFLFLITIYFISNIIVDVDINHENKLLKEYIKKIVKDYNILPLRYRIKDTKLNKISDEILKNNRDKIDFISIERRGMKYIISVEERILPENEIDPGYCHIIAGKNGVIKLINASHGIEVVEKGMYVKKGDILISGEIILNDEVKNNVCASGVVLADVWYKVKVSIPKIKKEKKYTGKSRYNFKINNKFFYNKNYEYYDEKCIFSFFSFKIYKQYEYKINDIVKKKDELIIEGIEIARKSILERTNKNNKIIAEKVLKDYENNSTIEIEIFINIEENIGISKKYEVGEIIDTE